MKMLRLHARGDLRLHDEIIPIPVSARRWYASRQLVSVALTCIGSVKEALEMQSWISHLC